MPPSKSVAPKKKTVKKDPVVSARKIQFKKPGKTTFLLALALLLIVAGFLFGPRYLQQRSMTNLKTKVIPEAIKKVTSGQALTLKAVDNVKDVSGVYQFDLTLSYNGQDQKYSSYITHDGKVLFISGIKIDEYKAAPAQASNQQPAKKLTASDLKKADSASLTAFIVSNCPYGLQTQRLFEKVLSEQPQMSNYLDVKYIGSVVDGKITSMHGDKEAQENLKQICIRDEQKEKYWSYVSCYMKSGDDKGCETQSGISSDQLNSCVADSARGLKYAQTDFDLANKFNISSSPTMLLNNNQIVSEFDFGGRVPDAVKQLVCGGSKTEPDFCKTDLSKESVAASFSETTGGSGTNTSANCNTN